VFLRSSMRHRERLGQPARRRWATRCETPGGAISTSALGVDLLAYAKARYAFGFRFELGYVAASRSGSTRPRVLMTAARARDDACVARRTDLGGRFFRCRWSASSEMLPPCGGDPDRRRDRLQDKTDAPAAVAALHGSARDAAAGDAGGGAAASARRGDSRRCRTAPPRSRYRRRVASGRAQRDRDGLLYQAPFSPRDRRRAGDQTLDRCRPPPDPDDDRGGSGRQRAP
jgi:hypothetical protein